MQNCLQSKKLSSFIFLDGSDIGPLFEDRTLFKGGALIRGWDIIFSKSSKVGHYSGWDIIQDWDINQIITVSNVMHQSLTRWWGQWISQINHYSDISL